MRRVTVFKLVAALALLQGVACASESSVLKPCRVEGMPNELQCGSVRRALDPARPNGQQIDVHFLVVPAMARNKQPDPVVLLAGGPGQSAISVAPGVLGRLGRLNNRRDLVFIDQRGTGRSAPLQCDDDERLTLKQATDMQAQFARLQVCREKLSKLPYGDMRFFTTSIAMQDFDAVRQALGAAQWNLVGASYGTRAALEYLRQFPDKVRRTVLDGVAPPDQVLPASMSVDTQAALDAEFAACEKEPQCNRLYPALRADWAALLKSLPRTVAVRHPVTGVAEQLTVTREAALRWVRRPLYAPNSASALPEAIHAAAQGRFDALMGLAVALGSSSKATRLAIGMHFSVVCAEDVPRLSVAKDKAGADFGTMDIAQYTQGCANWPKGNVPEGFYTVPPAPSPVLMLSGGADPVTPPRHAQRVAELLGSQARHVVVPEAGHGVMALGCMRDVVFKFVDTKEAATALAQDASCAIRVPRPGVFVPVQAASATQGGQP
ncbi:MAG: alpha/beta hydrolase [Rhodoferax sp.]|nr:alpha/beta hydrolase [Rhodoferax sp.]